MKLKSTVLLGIVSVVIMLSVVAVLTYPHTVISFPVSFSIGVDSKQRELNMPVLHGQVQVDVMVTGGTALWTAKILRGDDVLWSHSTSQGGHMSYRSQWIVLPNETYNFTYTTAGLGSLYAEIRVTTKGGFW